MKVMRLFSFLLFSVCLGVFALSAQDKQDKKKAKEKAIKELIKSGDYTINVSMAYPQRGSNVSLTSSYSLEIRNDSVISHLPFYGRAYSVPYGGGNALSFKTPLDEYEVTHSPKKEKYEVKLKAKTTEDTYQFTLDIFLNGSSRINVNMQNRESISFSGELDLLPL